MTQSLNTTELVTKRQATTLDKFGPLQCTTVLFYPACTHMIIVCCREVKKATSISLQFFPQHYFRSDLITGLYAC